MGILWAHTGAIGCMVFNLITPLQDLLGQPSSFSHLYPRGVWREGGPHLLHPFICQRLDVYQQCERPHLLPCS